MDDHKESFFELLDYLDCPSCKDTGQLDLTGQPTTHALGQPINQVSV